MSKTPPTCEELAREYVNSKFDRYCPVFKFASYGAKVSEKWCYGPKCKLWEYYESKTCRERHFQKILSGEMTINELFWKGD